jgi:hypothetical protein
VDPLSALASKTVSGGRLNLSSAVALATGEAPPPTAMVSPAATVQRDPAFTVSWATGAAFSSDLEYDVRYRRAALRQDFLGPQDWISATDQTSAAFSGEPGSTYCFSATVAGQADWGSESCTSVPVNDRDLARRKSWSSRAGSSFYLGTASKSTVRGSTLTLSGVRARTLALVASRCGSCGRVKVKWNGTLLKTISLRSSSTQRKRLLSVATFGSVQTGTLVIRVVSRGKPVLIEGLGVGVA